MTPTGDADPVDDAELIRASVTEPDRFGELFRRHADAVGRYLARRIGTQDAQDVLADTFLEAFRHRRRFDASRPDARPWLYGIATRRLGRYRRTELRQLRVLERTGSDPVVTPFTDRSDARVEAGAAIRAVAEVLRGLSAGQRDALLLVAWADLTYDQVATALGVPVGTVRSWISRGRATLRTALGGINPTIPKETEDA